MDSNHNDNRSPVESNSRKNSELIREAQATFSALPHKDALDLREFLNESSHQIKTYELTEENLKLLKRLRKFSFLSL